jgi:hypothetical protein
MNVNRREHTATLLPNGTVLVAGGCCDPTGHAQSSAEVYDPATGRWTLTGSLLVARQEGHTATLLPDGLVLVAGGYDEHAGSLAEAELYHPATGGWTATGSMNASRPGATATLLPTGQVLVAGDACCAPAGDSAELYDPSAGTWTATAPMVGRHQSATATLLTTGQVLVAGGGTAGSELFRAPLAIFHPSRLDFTAQPVGRPSVAHTITLTNSGPVTLTIESLSIAGRHPKDFTVSDNCSGAAIAPAGQCTIGITFTPAAPGTRTAVLNVTDSAPGSPQQVPLQGNKVPTVPPPPSPTPALRSGTWHGTGDLAMARTHHTATLLPDGTVLVAGGQSPTADVVASAELYDPAAGRWRPTAAMANARAGQAAILLRGGQVLVSGGFGSGLPTTRILATSELYDPPSGRWTRTGNMAVARWAHTATLLPGGRVLVAGGFGNGLAAPSTALASAELYAPATGRWHPTGRMIVARGGQTATLLRTGQVLVAGGGSAMAELYDPTTGRWRRGGRMSTNRYGHTATLLLTGKVLVVGGVFGRPLASAELYDPATGRWTRTGSLHTARFDHTATLLADGTVLVAGGSGDNSTTGALASAELYNPATGRWRPTGPLSVARARFTATLRSGVVLVAGGIGSACTDPQRIAQGCPYLRSSELYKP